MKPKIGLVGYFGWGNFGDELFVQAHKQHLSQYFDLQVVHDLLEAPYFSKDADARLNSFDGFLIGGGDLVNPNAVSPLYWRDAYLSKPVFVHGIGCPNTKVFESKSISKLKNFFNHTSVKHIALRDIESKQWFDKVFETSLETKVFPDAVFSLKIPARSKNVNKVLGVVLRSHRSLVGDYAAVRQAVDEAKSLGYSVKIIVGGTGDHGFKDLEEAQKFAKPDEEVVFKSDLMEVCFEISACSLILSMKFHVLVIGVMYGIPVIQLSSTLKNRNLFRYLQRPDLLGNYRDDNLYRRIPPVPAPIHSLIVSKLKRDSAVGYNLLRDEMLKVFD